MVTKQIDTVTNISNKDFKKNYFTTHRPVIIKGLTNSYSAGKKWTIEYIKNVCGDVIVDLYDNSKKNNSSAFTSPDFKMKFNDYINILLENKPTPLRIFLFNMFKERPELRKNFPCPTVFKGVLGRIGFMFFGSRGINVRIHQDMDMSNVMLTQFYGRKKVVLIAPKYSSLIYKLPFNTHSLIDLDNPNYEKYPGLHYIEIQECILEPGDSLFIPSGYWHYITYLEAGFSVSYRKLADNFQGKLKGLVNICIYMPIDKLMVKLFGKRWLEKKEEIAEQRANKVIQHIKTKAEINNSIVLEIQLESN